MKKQHPVKKENKRSLPSVKKTSPATADDAMTDAFINEVTDDVKNDNLKAFWKRYGVYVVLAVAIGVSAAVSFESVKSWYNAKFQRQTENYIAAVYTPDLNDAKNTLEKIASDTNGIYSELARIQIANILFEQNKNDEAVAVLEELSADSSLDETIQSLATLKLAAYKVDFAPQAEIQTLLAPLAGSDSVFKPLAQDLLAMSAIQNGNIEQARTIYADLLQSEHISENFRTRIQDMLSALSDL